VDGRQRYIPQTMLKYLVGGYTRIPEVI